MQKKLSFIEEAAFKGFHYRPNGILGNGFYGNGCYISLSDMEKYSKNAALQNKTTENMMKINTDYFIQCEGKDKFLTKDIIQLFPDIKEHQLHNFLNKFKDVFLSQKLFTIVNKRREYTKEAIKFIYNKLIKKEEPPVKKRGRRANIKL